MCDVVMRRSRDLSVPHHSFRYLKIVPALTATQKHGDLSLGCKVMAGAICLSPTMNGPGRGQFCAKQPVSPKQRTQAFSLLEFYLEYFGDPGITLEKPTFALFYLFIAFTTTCLQESEISTLEYSKQKTGTRWISSTRRVVCGQPSAQFTVLIQAKQPQLRCGQFL